jgi:hypothetical protein
MIARIIHDIRRTVELLELYDKTNSQDYLVLKQFAGDFDDLELQRLLNEVPHYERTIFSRLRCLVDLLNSINPKDKHSIALQKVLEQDMRDMSFTLSLFALHSTPETVN